MIITRKNLRSHLPFIILYISLLFIGIGTYKDYGISWDESVQRKDNGLVNYNYIHKNDYESLINGNEKYHGPVFEIALIYLEQFLELKNTRDIFLMRHLVTFLVFFISVLFFYLLCFRQFKSIWLSTIGTLFLILSPRIYADSFYNSKDLVFMSFVIINLYTTIIFLKNKNLLNALMHAFVCALVIDTRVLGVIIPAFTFLILFLDFIRSKSERKRIIFVSLFYTIAAVGLTILFWPVLWKDPIQNMILGFKEMSHYHWDSYMIFMGKRTDGQSIPWQYMPVWILVTTPFLYTILFFTGIFYLAKKLISRINLSTFEWFNLYIFFLPLLSIMIMHSVVYDGWRHLFFIYPSMIIISILGLKRISEIFEPEVKRKKIMNAGIVVYVIYIFFVMVRLHPYENVYFNSLAGSSINEARKNFEIDYWGLSYKEGIEYILRTDTSSDIILSPAENPGRDNLKIFGDEEMTRVSITARDELADYYISTYRYHHKPFLYKADFDVVRNDGEICSVFNLKKTKLALSDDKYKTAVFKNDFENSSSQWSGWNVVEFKDAFSGSKVQRLDSTVEFGDSFIISPPAELVLDGRRNYIVVKFRLYAITPFDTRIALQLDSGNAVMYDWDGTDLQSSITNRWLKQDYRTLLPRINSVNDKLKVYIWNYRRNHFYIDDMEIGFYSLTETEYLKYRSKLPGGLNEKEILLSK